MTVELATVSQLPRETLFHHLDQYAALLQSLTAATYDLRVMEVEQIDRSIIEHLDQGYGRVDAEKYARLACAEFEYQRRRSEASLHTTQVAYDHLKFVIEHRGTTDL